MRAESEVRLHLSNRDKDFQAAVRGGQPYEGELHNGEGRALEALLIRAEIDALQWTLETSPAILYAIGEAR
jgi:hypothetical protein